MVTYCILVGGIPTPLKNDRVLVSWDDDIPNIWNNEKCSKPPTSKIYWEIIGNNKGMWVNTVSVLNQVGLS